MGSQICVVDRQGRACGAGVCEWGCGLIPQLPTTMLVDCLLLPSLFFPYRLPQDARTLLPPGMPWPSSGLFDLGEGGRKGTDSVDLWILHLRDHLGSLLARHVCVQHMSPLPWVKKQVFTFPDSNPSRDTVHTCL